MAISPEILTRKASLTGVVQSLSRQAAIANLVTHHTMQAMRIWTRTDGPSCRLRSDFEKASGEPGIEFQAGRQLKEDGAELAANSVPAAQLKLS